MKSTDLIQLLVAITFTTSISCASAADAAAPDPWADLLRSSGGEIVRGDSTRRQQPPPGLQMSALASRGLQASSGLVSSGLTSSTRGLTATEEWRRMFPRREQR